MPHRQRRRRQAQRRGALAGILVAHALGMAALIAYRVPAGRDAPAAHLLLVRVPRPASPALAPAAAARPTHPRTPRAVVAAPTAVLPASPVSPAAPAAPAASAAPAPDWQDAARRAAQQAAAAPIERRSFALPAPLPRVATRPAFGWSEQALHPRVEVLPGGTVVHLGERCAIVIAPVPFPVCAIGKAPPPRGDLFEHLHDAPQAGDWRDPR